MISTLYFQPNYVTRASPDAYISSLEPIHQEMSTAAAQEHHIHVVENQVMSGDTGTLFEGLNHFIFAG